MINVAEARLSNVVCWPSRSLPDDAEGDLPRPRQVLSDRGVHPGGEGRACEDRAASARYHEGRPGHCIGIGQVMMEEPFCVTFKAAFIQYFSPKK